MTYDVVVEGKTYRVELAQEGDRWRCKVGERELDLDATLTARDVLSVIVGSKAYEIKRERAHTPLPTNLHIWVGTERYQAEVRDPRSWRSRKAAGEPEAGPRKLVALMPGKVVRVLVAARDAVEAGQGVLVVEAMKMQNEMKSPKQGVVIQILTAEGANVNAGDVLAIVE
jgi:biotin carboxyl carrier protein